MFPRTFLSTLRPGDVRKVKYIFVLTLVLSVTFYSWLFWTLFRDRMKDAGFTERDKCPACYGHDLCPHIDDGRLSVDGWSKYPALDVVNVKNVHTASLGDRKIILKKLGRDKEIKRLDRRICERAGGRGEDCDVTTALLSLPVVTARELDVYILKGMTDMMTCPSQRLVGIIKEKFGEKEEEEEKREEERRKEEEKREEERRKEEEKREEERRSGRRRGSSQATRCHLATILLINPEPILLQIFPPREGWPFPEYLGACGRLVAVENSGPPLTEFYNAPWEERVDYAYQIMMITELFTNNHLGFALYWTDLNYDNLAVNDKGKVVVIDLENIIVVDLAKIHREKRPGWDQPYYSSFDECPEGGASCVSFSATDLCSRYTCDFNYYTACRNVLSQYADEPARPGGLLHHLPTHIDTRLRPLLTECARPSTPGGRLQVKDKLIRELKKVRDDYL